MSRSMESMPPFFAVMTEENLASCKVWRELLRLHPQDLVALTPSDGSLELAFPGLEVLWYSVTERELAGDFPAFLSRLLESNPRLDLVLCLPPAAYDEGAWSAYFDLGVSELIFSSELDAPTRLIERTQLALRRRRREREKQQEAKQHLRQTLQHKNDRLAWLSHEIRTPLNGLMGLIEILQSSELHAEQKEMLEVMDRCSRTVLTHVNAVLDLAKLEASKMRLDLETFELSKLVEDVLLLYSRQAQLKGLLLYNITAPEVPLEVIGDAQKLSQILSNFISNAIKFTSTGRIRLGLELEKQENRESCLLRFEVRDSGYGISESELPLLFTPFEQTSSHRQHQGPGSGLGLTVSKQLIELMGGKVEVQSTPGQGTCFVFFLPFQLPHTRRLNALVPMPHAGEALIIGDESDRCEALSEIVGTLGFKVSTRSAAESLPRVSLYIFTSSRARMAIPDSSVKQQVFVLDLGEGPKRENLSSLSEVLLSPLRFSDLARRFKAAVELHRSLDKVPRSQPLLSPRVVLQKRILVVDDDPLNLRVAKRQLSRLAADITVAQSGLEALRLLEKQNFDLIFVDRQMPHMDGSQLLQVLRQLPDRSALAPVVALTALAGTDDRQRILAEGFDDYLAKPAQLEDITRVIERWLMKEVSLKDA